jgi:hypothetical protein
MMRSTCLFVTDTVACGSATNKNLIGAKLPPAPKSVIPEAILIGNPACNRLESWIPDSGIRG